jgi:hypothetical protein
LHSVGAFLALIGTLGLTACGPQARIPPRPINPVGQSTGDSVTALANRLAPVLYLQRDETFPLERVVAVVHPTEPVVAYHLLWRDDAHGAWLPFTIPTDEELVWVGYDSTGQPTRVWTYWHGAILHTSWRNKGRVLIDVQWGKHGSLPRGIDENTLPIALSLDSYFLYAWVGTFDILLGRLVRPGPSCFCGSYKRYREFTRPMDLAGRLDAVVQVIDAKPTLERVFGALYSRKPEWPPGVTGSPYNNPLMP